MSADDPLLGEILRSAREAAGWSLARMGRATGYSKPYLSRLETGGKEVKAWHVEAYDRALGGQVTQERAARLLGDSVVSPDVWAELDLPVIPPGRVGTGDVAALAESADYLTGLGLRHGGQAVVAATRGQLRYAAGLLDASMTGDVREALSATVGRLADRAAWATADVGQPAGAQKLYDLALSVAPDEAQRWATLVNIADLKLSQGDHLAAGRLLDREDPSQPVLRFVAHAARAEIAARSGAYGATLRHIDEADRAHAAVDVNDLPVPIRPYSSGHAAHAHATAGKALYTLARGGKASAVPLAVERLQAAVEAFGSERSRAIMICRSRLDDLAER